MTKPRKFETQERVTMKVGDVWWAGVVLRYEGDTVVVAWDHDGPDGYVKGRRASMPGSAHLPESALRKESIVDALGDVVRND